MKSFQVELEQMLKVDSPAPNAENMPNCPTWNENFSAAAGSRNRMRTDFTSTVCC
jgi:hypothetical protein